MLIDYLKTAVAKGASDLHLSVGAAPAYRIQGKLSMDGKVLGPEDTQQFARQVMASRQWAQFEQLGEADLTYTDEQGRFRVNVYQQRGNISAAVRVIPNRIPTLEELQLPPVVKHLCQQLHGLVIVTGPTGSGKSTTLAALLNYVNETRGGHIITLEDPVEYWHPHQRAIIDQREIGIDTLDFAAGLRAALRQDPDVIMVGEMRDLQTIQTAVTAAETGHLVLATMHTHDAVATVHRIIDVFPAIQQNQIRVQLAAVLQGVIAQQLIRRRSGNGRLAAVELLLNTPAVANLIRSQQVHQIRSILQTAGKDSGMQTMANHLEQLVLEGAIEHQDGIHDVY